MVQQQFSAMDPSRAPPKTPEHYSISYWVRRLKEYRICDVVGSGCRQGMTCSTIPTTCAIEVRRSVLHRTTPRRFSRKHIVYVDAYFILVLQYSTVLHQNKTIAATGQPLPPLVV